MYDRPSQEADFAGSFPAHRTIVQDPYGVAKTDRIPVLVQVEAGGSVSTRPLPQLDPTGKGVLSGNALWWYVGRYSGQEFGNDNELFYCDLAGSAGSDPFRSRSRTAKDQLEYPPSAMQTARMRAKLASFKRAPWRPATAR